MAIFELDPVEQFIDILAPQQRLRLAQRFGGLGEQRRDHIGQSSRDLALGDDMADQPELGGGLGPERLAE